MNRVVFFFFFFSSRRRHTRCLSDWSSDVCSSDLIAATEVNGLVIEAMRKIASAFIGAASSRSRQPNRSEERRVGKECRSRWSPDHKKKKDQTIRQEPAQILDSSISVIMIN